jgi:hypothetical protein
MANTTHRVLTLNLTSTSAETLSLDPIPQIGSANIADGSIMDGDISANAGIALSKLADVSGSDLSLDAYLYDLSNNFSNFLVTDADVDVSANIALSKLADVSGSGLSLEAYLYDLSNNISGISDLDADENTRGYVSFGAQSFGGAKTFKDVVTIDEHQTGTSYSSVLNVPIKPYLIVPTSTLSGSGLLVGGGYFKYAVKQSTSLGNNTNGIAIVCKDVEDGFNSSFFAELTYLASSSVSNNDGTLTYTSTATTTKLILTCTGLSVVNTLLGEQHDSNNISVTTNTRIVDGLKLFVILVNGIPFDSLLLDFYGAEQIWQINAISINPETGNAEDVADDLVTYGFDEEDEI